MTSPPFLLFAISCIALGALGIPVYIRTARARNILDIPNQRSSHSVPTPRGGGIFIPIGLIASGLFGLWELESLPETLSVLVTVTAVAFIGFIDDLRSLPSSIRLAAHLACGISVAWTFLPSVSPTIALLIITLSTIWLVGSLNIFNFMDGIDGIATCQGIATAAISFIIASDSQNALGSILAISALGGLLAFLFFNWPPAKVFMGDSSSGTLGFLFGAFPLLIDSPDLYDLLIHINYGALALFPFLFDGTFTLFRRAYLILARDDPQSAVNNQRSLARLCELTEAHRTHLYQRWVQSGKSHRFVTSAYALWATLCSTVCLLSYFNLSPLWISWIIASLPALALIAHSKRFPSS